MGPVYTSQPAPRPCALTGSMVSICSRIQLHFSRSGMCMYCRHRQTHIAHALSSAGLRGIQEERPSASQEAADLCAACMQVWLRLRPKQVGPRSEGPNQARTRVRMRKHAHAHLCPNPPCPHVRTPHSRWWSSTSRAGVSASHAAYGWAAPLPRSLPGSSCPGRTCVRTMININSMLKQAQQ